ncbi:putative ribosomal protein L34Ae [Medicago truncatula]|uniref:Putative ribosomal protein L34Ae n=1 Tax=Medicago truncatula TaxID=3880 RepID=G7KF75_MEDTR|nr:uncharacterized protein LOC11420111 [Medicago truncatula]AES96721.2 transmembrane protein, putative [Medicago truncatula]RHN55375.1 putative ribosomal protein L34Ae [Medicago truncatula]
MALNFVSVRVFISNYVFYSFGLILRFFLRFLNLGDAKKDLINLPSQSLGDGNFHDFKVDGFVEELSNFLFWSDDFHQRETECSVFMDSVHEEKTEFSVLKEIHNDFHEDSVKTEIYMESVLSKVVECEIHEEGIDKEKEDESVQQDGGKENEGVSERFVSMENDPNVDEMETKSFVCLKNGYDLCHDHMKIEEKEEEIIEHAIVENNSNVHEDGRIFDGMETEYSVFMENVSDVIEDGEKIVEKDIEESVFKDDEDNLHEVSKKIGGIETMITVFGNDDDNKIEEETEQETEDSVFVESETIKTTTSRYEYFSEKDISCFVEEPTTLRFSFREYYTSPDVSTISQNANKEFSKLDSEKDIVTEELEEKEKESIHSTDIPLLFESEAFGGTDSSDEDYFIFNENSVTSDSESESSSSSGLIWSNSNKIDDSFSYEFLGSKNGSEILKLMMRDETIEDLDENQSSFDDKVSKFGVDEVYSENEYIEMDPHMKGLKTFEEHGFEVKDQKEGMKKSEEELNGSESDEDDFEWEHEEIVEQLKLELKNSRQGGLATIIEEVEDEEEQEQEEKESPKVVEELKPLKIEVKLEFKDQMDQIEKVYKSYAEKMRKLDILNYQTMHALGLLQLKDPLKLISIPKSTISNGIISQNLWPRKSTKITSDPFLKLVHQLHRDLELVYVGQICLSWEILCWLHMKAIELQQYDSQRSHRYNHVAGEFQLFQVLMQRFIENEPFQGGPRIQNYVKNRCVIRNLLHVPAIKDDIKGGEEDPIASGRLQDIIKESMRVFWEFVRTDKDNGNVNVISKQIGSDLKDPAIANLLVDIRIQLQKKDKKLKDIVRTGNCIVKKFQKHHEDQLDHEQLVAQVGLRLISRVINMSQLRKEQVLWCSEKLNRIKFLSRKIVHVEPSFLLFPC